MNQQPIAPEYELNNIQRELIPLTIINKTKRSNLFFYLNGTSDPNNPGGNWYYLKDLDGNVSQCHPNDSTTDYSIQITEDEQKLKLPRLSAMRMYFSFDKKLEFTVGPHGIPDSPSGWNVNMNYHTLFDFIEPTWEINPNEPTISRNTFGWNTSQVDMFGLPITLELTGLDDNGNPTTGKSGFNEAGLRNKIFNAIFNAPAPWNQLLISDGNFYPRVLCPYKGMELNLFPEDHLDGYINDVWKHYETHTLKISFGGIAYSGQVTEQIFVFKPDNGEGEILNFPKPTSKMVYEEGPKPAAGTSDMTTANMIKKALGAGFMRSTLLANPEQPVCDSTKYYEDGYINWYAKTFHEYGMDHKAYAFGFDDVCSQSSFFSVHYPESAKITLLEF